jgi:hypothetical protein
MTTSSNKTPAAGSTPSGGGFCAACGNALLAGGKFCHRCGTPVGQGSPSVHVTTGGSLAAILPWAVAFVALLAVIVIFAGRNFGASGGSAVDGSANALPTTAMDGAGAGRAPDISSMSPEERASSLYNRIMTYAEQGQVDSVAFFAPMALGAHEMLTAPTVDERYHFGRIAELVDNGAVARAQADTILANQPRSLLGLLLASRAARMTGNATAASAFDKRLLDALDAELATNNEDYRFHRPEIDRAAQDARSGK